MHISKYLFIFIILLIITSFCSPKLQSQDRIYFRDTTIQRASINLIPVYCDFKNLKDGDNLDIVFSFDARIIDIKGIITGDGYWANKQTINPDTNLARLDSATLKISAANIKVTNNPVLCTLLVEGFA